MSSSTDPHQRAEHIPFLDAIRGFAALSVFLYHSLGASFGYDQLPWIGQTRGLGVDPLFLTLLPLSYGRSGVAVFFVVSGLCIHLSHARNSEAGWLAFARRRLSRIYPPYLFALLLIFIVFGDAASLLQSAALRGDLLSHLALVHNGFEPYLFGINPSFWSIAVEAQLYLIYPLVWIMASRFGWRTTLAITATTEVLLRGSLSAHYLFGAPAPPCFLAQSPFAYWFSWSLGCYLAHCHLNKTTPPLLAGWAVPTLAIAAFLVPFFRVTDPFTFLTFSLLTTAVVSRLLARRWTLPDSGIGGRLVKHLGFLGIVSYSFYLLHQPSLKAADNVCHVLGIHSPSAIPMLLACGVLYPIVLALAYTMYQCVELPSSRLGRPRHPASNQVAVAATA